MSNRRDDSALDTSKGVGQLSRSKRVILIVFIIWLAQALPKWYVAITADGELSAKIIKVFITPRTELN